MKAIRALLFFISSLITGSLLFFRRSSVLRRWFIYVVTARARCVFFAMDPAARLSSLVSSSDGDAGEGYINDDCASEDFASEDFANEDDASDHFANEDYPDEDYASDDYANEDYANEDYANEDYANDASNDAINDREPQDFRKRPSSPEEDISVVHKRRRFDPVVEILGGLVNPRSMFKSFDCEPRSVVEESKAIWDLKEIWYKQKHTSDEHMIFELDHFSVYRPPESKRHGNELAPLHKLNAEAGFGELMVDGVLSYGKEKRYVQDVRFKLMSVEGYGKEDTASPSPNITICIQSRQSARHSYQIWYQLGGPAPEYRRYYEPFLWVAQLGKHFVDFLTDASEACSTVCLNDFRSDFFKSISSRYENSSAFQSWAAQYGSQDFRQTINAYVKYLRNELGNLPGRGGLLKQPLWGETALQLTAIPEEPCKHDKTVVTRFIYGRFKRMPFHTAMKILETEDKSIQIAQRERRSRMEMTPLDCQPTETPQHPYSKAKTIEKGDVVCIAAEKDSKWKGSIADHWYAYVQGVQRRKNGSRRLDLLWLYHPSDTTLGQGDYPYQNELFMSDNCCCGREAVDEDSVLGTTDVAFFATDPNAQASFFVRQTFHTVHEEDCYSFVKLNQSHFKCKCNDNRSEMDEVLAEYSMNDTVLVQLPESELLEPVQILSFEQNRVTVRRFARSRRDLKDPMARVNQLVFTTLTDSVEASQIVRRCYVRLFTANSGIATPFDRDGAGDLFFVMATHADQLVFPPSNQGELPTLASYEKLKAMGIFCGGGNFDRGLEEGGAVEFHYAIDWAAEALHTYRANLADTDKVHFFLGSVNDYLAKAIRGSKDRRIARVGSVQVLLAGSPCPGFSVLQPDKQSEQSLRNCSLVAAVMAYIDFYTPEYMILENVTGLAGHPKGRPDLNVFSQVLCCLVAMGYQVQQFLGDPRGFGSPQTRARIFIVASAPGCTPLPGLPQTHSSKEMGRGFNKSIGKATNGLSFGKKRNDVAPFECLSVKDAIGDLPNISDSHVQSCIPSPDHRTTRNENSLTRNSMVMIPRWPHGMGFVQAVNMRDDAQYKRTPIGLRQIQAYAWKNKYRAASSSNSWSRLFPDKAVGCLTTQIHAQDAFLGRVVHYDQPRLMTVMEARRTQGFPDDEVVIGIPTAQWKIIGNSVDRKVALALGLSLSKAWSQTLKNRVDSTVVEVAATTSSKIIVAEEDNNDAYPPQATMAQTNTISVTRKSVLPAHHLPTPDLSGPGTPTSGRVELLTESTVKPHAIIDGALAPAPRSRDAKTLLQKEVIVIDDSTDADDDEDANLSGLPTSSTLAASSRLAASLLLPRPDAQIRTREATMRDLPVPQKKRTSRGWHSGRGPPPNSIIVIDSDDSDTPVGGSKEAETSSSSEPRRLRRLPRSKRSKGKGRSLLMQGKMQDDSQAETQDGSQVETQDDTALDDVFVGTRRGTQKSRIPSSQHVEHDVDEGGSRGEAAEGRQSGNYTTTRDARGSDSIAGGQRTTRRSGGGDLVVPSNWAEPVEHSVPMRARKHAD